MSKEKTTPNENDSKYSVTVYGKEYSSLGSVAEKFGIARSTLTERVRLGDTIEEAIEKGRGKGVTNNRVAVFGREYKDMVDLAKSYGIDYIKLQARLKDGRSLEEAVEALLNEKLIVFNGKTYQSKIELCLEYKMEYDILNNRLKLGWSLEKALTKPIRTRKSNRSYKYKGNEYTSIRKLTESQGFYRVFIATIQERTSLDFIEALDMVVQFTEQYKGDRPELISRLPFIIYNGKWFNTLKSFCEEVGADSGRLANFMRQHKIESHFKALEMMREKAHSFPNCTFKITGYCATPNLDFEVFLKERFG